jgi:hypothetical protein
MLRAAQHEWHMGHTVGLLETQPAEFTLDMQIN